MLCILLLFFVVWNTSVRAVYILKVRKGYFKSIKTSIEPNPALAWKEKNGHFFEKCRFLLPRRCTFLIKSKTFVGYWLHLWGQESLNFCIRAKVKHGLHYGMSNKQVTTSVFRIRIETLLKTAIHILACGYRYCGVMGIKKRSKTLAQFH